MGFRADCETSPNTPLLIGPGPNQFLRCLESRGVVISIIDAIDLGTCTRPRSPNAHNFSLTTVISIQATSKQTRSNPGKGQEFAAPNVQMFFSTEGELRRKWKRWGWGPGTDQELPKRTSNISCTTIGTIYINSEATIGCKECCSSRRLCLRNTFQMSESIWMTSRTVGSCLEKGDRVHP